MISLRNTVFGLTCGASLVLAGAARADSVVETGSTKVQVRTFEILDKDMTHINFAVGSSTLSADDRKTLEAFVGQAKGEGAVDKFIVAAWSDKELPLKGELSKAERKLADARAKNVADALKDGGAKSVDKFEMTKEANWIQRTFSTEAAEVKGEGRDHTASERLYSEIGEKLRHKGGPGTVVVVAKFKHEVVAH